jgi:hypothetical protein
VQIDHVVWTTADPVRTEALIGERYGLTASGGGSHSGHGTHNRIFPLGGGFLELLAIDDPRVAESSPIGRGVANAGEGLFTWVIAVADTHEPARRLGLDEIILRRGSVEMPLAGVARSFQDGALPFFIQRPADQPIPGAEGEDGGIVSLEVGCDPDELASWLGGAALPVECRASGRRGLLSVTLGSGKVLKSL